MDVNRLSFSVLDRARPADDETDEAPTEVPIYGYVHPSPGAFSSVIRGFHTSLHAHTEDGLKKSAQKYLQRYLDGVPNSECAMILRINLEEREHNSTPLFHVKVPLFIKNYV